MKVWLIVPPSLWTVVNPCRFQVSCWLRLSARVRCAIWVEKSISDVVAADELAGNDGCRNVALNEGGENRQHDVTNAEFRKFAEATGYKTTAERPVNWDKLKSK